jgi:hypothetical protein
MRSLKSLVGCQAAQPTTQSINRYVTIAALLSRGLETSRSSHPSSASCAGAAQSEHGSPAVAAGKFTQGWADFELKDGKLMRRVGITQISSGQTATDAAS